jgi:hypothetical protein
VLKGKCCRVVERRGIASVEVNYYEVLVGARIRCADFFIAPSTASSK